MIVYDCLATAVAASANVPCFATAHYDGNEESDPVGEKFQGLL
jgi:hypothetical protein